MDLRVWQSLAKPQNAELVRLAMGVERGDVSGIARLRRVCSDAEVVRAALMLGEARRKAVGKFGAKVAAGLWADVAGVEMASSAVVAEHKARRIWGSGARAVVDLCCGIGGDAMGLVKVQSSNRQSSNSEGKGVCVTGVDLDPVRAWMAGRNAGCVGVCGDAIGVEVGDALVHIDPARRVEGGVRVWRSEDLRPSVADVRGIVEKTRWGGAVKLGPGADLAEIERELPGCSVEVISERGTLVQAVAWCGEHLLARPGEREATLITRTPDEEWSDTSSCTIAGVPDEVELPETGGRAARYVYEPDDSVERAGLLGVLCEKLGAPMLHPRVGLLTSDVLIRSQWVCGFEVVAEMAWNERRMKRALEGLDGGRGAGIVEVKTRGGVVDTDEMQGRLRGRGEMGAAVFVLRLGKEMRGVLGRRVVQATNET